jgi:hypothetical protein
MLIFKSQIETTPAFMGAVLRLPFDQKFLIRKQVQAVCLYIDAESPRYRSVLPLPGTIDGYTRESSPSRLRAFVSCTFVPASNRGILFMCRSIILLVVVCLHSLVGIALDPTSHISKCWAEPTDRAQGLGLTLTQVVGLFRIWSGVLKFEKDRFTAIIRLGIKQHFGMCTPFAKDHKGRIDRDPAQPGIDAGSALKGMAPQMRSQKCLLQSVLGIFRILGNCNDRL